MRSPLGQNLPSVFRADLIAPYALVGGAFAWTELGASAAEGSVHVQFQDFTAQNQPRSLAFAGSFAIWGNVGDGAVRFAQSFGGSAVGLLADNQNPVAVAAASTTVSTTTSYTVYWANQSQGSVVSCSSFNQPACPAEGPTQIATSQDAPHSVAVDASAVYWATATEILKCPLAGCVGPPIRVAAQQGPHDIVVSGGSIYWTDRRCNAVMTCLVTGCGASPTVLASGLTGPNRIIVSGTYVYWTNDDGRVLGTAK
jgi:hypothetical protein